jgi:hypothetical protein
MSTGRLGEPFAHRRAHRVIDTDTCRFYQRLQPCRDTGSDIR